MAIIYTLAAVGVVPGLLGFFHWLSRVPEPTAPEAEERPVEVERPVSVADEAQRWLQSQS